MHVRDLIEQVLFTAPGERVMLPDFGSGAARLVFAPNSVEFASATQMLVQASLQRWLGELIVVQGVTVAADDATLDHHHPVSAAQHRTGRTADLPASARRAVMIYTCCDKQRRDAVAADPTLNGIDYLEVIDSDLSDTDPLRQRTLLVHCLEAAAGRPL